jgi:hypothetical protein
MFVRLNVFLPRMTFPRMEAPMFRCVITTNIQYLHARHFLGKAYMIVMSYKVGQHPHPRPRGYAIYI